MSETQKANTKKPSIWVIALLVSIAVNGLLAGLLISKGLHNAPPMHETPAVKGSMQAPMQTMSSDPRKLVRTLPPARRRQVMKAAFKNLNLQRSEHPRQYFKQLSRAKMDMRGLLQADKIDADALEKSLSEIRAINQKLAMSGDALMLEVLRQLTPEERKTALATMKTQRHQRRQKRRDRKP